MKCTSVPDPVGVLLGTGYQRFETEFGIHGLWIINGQTLDLLAIGADEPGTGQFRRFMEAAKQEYRTIKVWAVDNPFLPMVLIRYGFRPTTERHMLKDGTTEQVEGFRWDR